MRKSFFLLLAFTLVLCLSACAAVPPTTTSSIDSSQSLPSTSAPVTTVPTDSNTTVPSTPNATLPTEPNATVPTVPNTTAPTEPPVTEPPVTEPPATEPHECAHNYQITENTPSTCLQTGLLKYACALCGHSYQMELPLADHKYADATCAKPKTCTVCKRSEGAPLGHNYILVETVQPTCATNGHTKYACSRCNDSYSSQLPALPHTFGQATCTVPQTCTVCSQTNGNALGHNYQIAKQVAATCTEKGYTQHTCARCADTYQDEIPMLPHSFADATCTNPQTCTSCGITQGNALDHNYVNNICSRCNLIDSNFAIPLGGYDGSEVTITFYHNMGAHLRSILEYYIEEFNKQYPNIHIVHKSLGDYDGIRDQINSELAVGTGPNIAYCYPDHVAGYNLLDGVVNLDGLIGSTITFKDAYGRTQTLGLTMDQLNDFVAGFLNAGCQFGDNLTYSLPLYMSTEVMYYDKTFFEQHNLKVPTTWDELEALCAQIKQIDPNCIPLGYDSESNWFINMCAQYSSDYTSASGEHYLFDNVTNRDFAARIRQWHQLGYCTTQETYGGYTSNLFTATSGTRCYISIASASGATYQRPQNSAFEVGVATIPQVDPANPKVISQGPSLCLFQSENPQEVIASWLFMKFLTTNVDFQVEISMANNYLPVIRSATEHEVYQSFLSRADGYTYLSARTIQVALSQRDAYFTPPAFVGSATAREIVGNLLVQAMTLDYSGDATALIKELFEQAVHDCTASDIPPADTPGSDEDLNASRMYLQMLYLNEPLETPLDYRLLSMLLWNNKEYTIEWSADSNLIHFTYGQDGYVTVHVPVDNREHIPYTLTATIRNSAGESVTITFNRYVLARTFIPTDVASGTYVIIWNGHTFTSLGEDKNYGYPTFNEVIIIDGTVTGHTVADVMTITKVDGGFTIQDAYGRYIYLKGTYNSFNISASAPEDGHIWQLLVNKDGQYMIVNKMNGKTLALDTAYGSWGAYDEITDSRKSELSMIPATAPEAEPEPEQPNNGEITTPVAGTAYKLGLVHGGRGNAMMYFTGVSEPNHPWYMLSSTNVAEAIDVFVEEVDGGLRLYFTIDGTKTYLDMHKDGAHYSLRLTTEPTAVYTWNTEHKTLVAQVDDKECFIGTSGTYDTFSCNKLERVSSSFLAHLYGEGGATETPDTPATPEKPATLAEQIAEANKLANKQYLTYESTITGTIIDEPMASSKNPGSYKFTVSDGANTLLCYYVPVSGGTPKKGDTITVTGNLTAYNGAAQFSEGHASAVLAGGSTTEPTAVYTWNAGHNTFVAMVDDKVCFIGTYNTYDTFACLTVNRVETSFVAHLYTVVAPSND